MRRSSIWIGALLVSAAWSAAPAQAAFLTGGTSHPGNASTNGFVDVQVYTLDAGGGYGTGSGVVEGALAGSTKSFLYLYETTNGPSSPDIAQNTVQAITSAITAQQVFGGVQFSSHPGGTPATVDAAGTGFVSGGPVTIVGADASTFGPTGLTTTPSSVAANYVPGGGLTGTAHGALWG
jgi:hypothetical protein